MDNNATIDKALADMQEPSLIDQACADAISMALDEVLKEWGIQADDDEETRHAKMDEAHIVITEQDWTPQDSTGQLSGLVVYRVRNEAAYIDFKAFGAFPKDLDAHHDVEPLAFITNPFIGPDGKVTVRLINYKRHDRVDSLVGPKLVQ